MKSKNTEEQLELFFKQDPSYLKTYVREHPDNKMAWYLLGRDYEAQGKAGKALYCYAQAGEVYEAYENQKVQLPAEEIRPIEQWGARRKAAHRRRWVRRAAMLLLLCAGIVAAPEWEWQRPAADIGQTPAPPLPEGVTVAQVQQTKVYYTAAEKTKEALGAALQTMLMQERISSFAILARGVPLGGTPWIAWQRKPEVLLSVEAAQDAAEQQIRYHDAASCNCTPSDPAKADAIVAAWQTKQEQEIVLRSAIAAYAKRTGAAPANAAALTAPYPNNILPGLTPYMKTLLEKDGARLAAEAAAQAASGAQQQAGGAAPASGAAGDAKGAASGASQHAAVTQPMTEPLRIVVDRTSHRLAVISGGLVVRNYAVGLGGPRTPEGAFVISEKVRNPNGKSDGDFGSRGMTLSDTNYAIHGTNKPSSIGKDQSLGCIRMRQEDVEELFDLVPMGTPVTIGRGLLPLEELRSAKPFTVPVETTDTNPNKVYHWLD